MTEEISDWGGIVYTFSSGRTAKVRPHLPLAAMYRRAVAQGQEDIVDRLQEMEKGELTDPLAAFPVQDLLIQTMFIEPEVLPIGAKCAPGQITVDDLTDEDVLEVCALAMGGVEDAARFRDELARIGDGSGGEDVEPAPKRTRKRAVPKG